MHYLTLSLRGFVPLTLLTGAWIYYPRGASHLMPGIGVSTDCASPPSVSIATTAVDETTYEVHLQIGGLSACKMIKLRAPPQSYDFILVRDMADFPPPEQMAKALRDARTPLPIRGNALNVLGQRVLTLDLDAVASASFAVEMRIDGIIADSFEKYRLLIPRSMAIEPSSSATKDVELTIGTVQVLSAFDILDVSPTPIGRRRQFGPEILYFGDSKLSELNVLLLSRQRDLIKNVFNAFALAIAASVIAATISSLTAGRP
jgi:hypothetical protein